MARDKATQSPHPNGRAGRKLRPPVQRPGMPLIVCTALYALILLGVTIMNVAGADRWWFGSLNLFLPQWPWALPCVAIVPWYLMSAWRWTWVPLLLIGWVFGPIMGYTFGLARVAPRPHGVKLRVMTYNVKWGMRDAASVIANITAADPDVIVMQDSAGSLESRLSALRKSGWYEAIFVQYTVLSRFPIVEQSQRWLTPQRDRECLRCVLRVGSKDVILYDVHLITPRWALGIVADHGSEGSADLQENSTLRDLEAFVLAEQIRSERGPLLLAGDLNSPVQSRVFQYLFRSGLRDAFSEAGWGYGYTYGQSTPLERPFVRIDHIMVSPEWAVTSCTEGGARGSDHSPVTADLVLPD